MEYLGRRSQAQVAVGPDGRVDPLAVDIIAFEHVIGKYGTKNEVAEIDLIDATFLNFLDSDVGDRGLVHKWLF